MFRRSAPIFCLCIALPSFGEADERTTNSEPGSDDEELITIGVIRDGDYSLITEDTQKLVETAGAQGDPLAAIFSLPGVVYSAGQGSEPAVRGSSPSDNQYIVDFMPASYIFHEFGVSIFSEYILHDFQMYSAGVGAEYNDVTGAVFNVNLRDPKNQDLGGVLDLSMLRSGVFVESGLTENSAFYLSYRKSLLHLFVKEEDLTDEDEGLIVQELPEDSDYQFKYLWSPADNHKIFLNANGAVDSAAAEFTEEAEFVRSNPDFEGDASFDQSYSGQNIVWEYSGDDGKEFKLGLGVLNDAADLNWGDDDYLFDLDTIRQTLKTRYSFPIGETFRLALGGEQSENEFGYELDMPLFVCTEFDPDCETRRQGRVQANNGVEWSQFSGYGTGVWQPLQKLSFELGAQYQSNDFTQEEFVNPRVSISYQLFSSTSLSAKAGSYNQFPEPDFIFEETGNPELKSTRSNHYTLGIQQEFRDGWSVNVETYFKTFSDLPLAIGIDEPDADRRYANDTEGEAYGVDLMVNKNLTDKMYGWMSFSYGKSKRKNLRTEETSEYYLDTPLIFNMVFNYQVLNNLNLGWRWSIRSGSAYTPIVGVQENPYFEDSVLPVYGEAYSDRLPTYNRLDFRLKWDTQTFGLDSALILDVINALNNQNVDDRVLDYDADLQPGDEPETTDIVDFGLQPALTYRISF